MKNKKPIIKSMACLMKPANFQPVGKPRINVYDSARLQIIRAKSGFRYALVHYQPVYSK